MQTIFQTNNSYTKLIVLGLCSFLLLTSAYSADAKTGVCGNKGIWIQVLGSGGPEANDGRASSGYLVWLDGHARILIDMGPGSMLRFEQSGARIEDLDIVLLSHLHVDHSADLPTLIKAAYFTARTKDLPVYGPSGNSVMPDTTTFVQSLFNNQSGAYRYLSSYLNDDEAFRLRAHNVTTESRDVQLIIENQDYKIAAVAVHHGPIPALAFRIDVGGHAIAFSGDMNGDYHTLPVLATGVDLLVAHHAIPQTATGVALNLHMPPSVIGEIAAEAKVKKLVLSHRMRRTLGREAESKAVIRKYYHGPLTFADDGQCFKIN